jgi:hypothetical protein
MDLHEQRKECDHYNLNVKFFIFFKRFYKVHSVQVLSQGIQVLSQDLVNKGLLCKLACFSSERNLRNSFLYNIKFSVLYSYLFKNEAMTHVL